MPSNNEPKAGKLAKFSFTRYESLPLVCYKLLFLSKPLLYSLIAMIELGLFAFLCKLVSVTD